VGLSATSRDKILARYLIPDLLILDDKGMKRLIQRTLSRTVSVHRQSIA